MDLATLTPVHDAETRSGAGTTNLGSATILAIGYRTATASEQLGYFKFDLSDIPAGAVITSATFSLYAISTDEGEAGNRSHGIYRVSGADWDESTITHNNRPSDTGSAAATKTINSGATGYQDFTGLASLVQDWIDGVNPNYGFVVKHVTGSQAPNINYGSSENSTAGQRPKLVIEFEVPTEIASSGFINDSALQGYWRMNQNWNDSSPNGYNLTPANSPTNNNIGRFEECGDFESGSSQYAENTSVPNLRLTSNQTLLGWFKAESINGGAVHRIFGRGNGSAPFNFVNLLIDSGVIKFQAQNLTTNTEVSSGITAQAGKWYYVAGVYDSTNSKLKIFVDGVKTEVTASGSVSSNGNESFAIGRCGSYAADYFDGFVDDVTVFNRALSDSEILAIFEGTSSPSPSSSASASTSPSPSASVSPSASTSPSSSASASTSPSSSVSASTSPSASISPSASESPTPSASASISPSSSPSSSESPSPSISPSASQSASPSASASASPSPQIYYDKYSSTDNTYTDKYTEGNTEYDDKYEEGSTEYTDKYNTDFV